MGTSEIKEMQLQESVAASFIIFEVPVYFPLWSLGSGYDTQKAWIRTTGRQWSTTVLGSRGAFGNLGFWVGRKNLPAPYDLNGFFENLGFCVGGII